MQHGVNEALAAFQRGQLDRAREIASSELEQQPESSQLQHLLGLIDCRAGRLDSGVEWLRRAAEADPGNIGFKVMLVRALVDSGRATDALEIAIPPAGTTPAELALWQARAEAADAAERPGVSAEAWQALCSAKPSDWRAWANQGDALARVDRWQEAAVCFRQAWMRNRNEPLLQRKLTTALIRAGLQEEAIEELREVVAARPNEIESRLTLARLLADVGRHEDAVAQLDETARMALGADNPESGGTDLIKITMPGHSPGGPPPSEVQIQSVRELALLLERTSRMEPLRDLLAGAKKHQVPVDKLGYPAAAVALRDGKPGEAERLLKLETPEDDPIRWHRLMAKIKDAEGDYPSAFAAAGTMNRLVMDFDTWRARAKEYRTRLRNLEQSITPEWIARLRTLEPGSRRSPVFLVGFPRSGTTLLDTFLMGHPDAQVLEEFHMLGAAETVLGHLTQLPSRTLGRLGEARQAYFAELDRHADPSFPGLTVDKLPLNMLGLPVIYSLFPDARVIFAQRHPCDAVLSGFMQSFVLNEAMACFLTIEDAADLYDVVLGTFSSARDALPLATHTLVYEQLVSDPEAALRPLIEFLGLEWRPELLDHRSTAKARGAIITPSYDQVIQPLSRLPSGRWRRYEEQLAPVLPVLLPWAERLGYAD